MLKFLFDKDSKLILAVEAVSIFGAVMIGLAILHGKINDTSILFFCLNHAIYLFIRYCSFKRWHPNRSRTAGIGLHFKKAIIPTAYILAFTNWLYILNQNSWALFAGTALLLFLVHVNIVLLFIHHRYNDQTPANLFSSSTK